MADEATVNRQTMEGVELEFIMLVRDADAKEEIRIIGQTWTISGCLNPGGKTLNVELKGAMTVEFRPVSASRRSKTKGKPIPCSECHRPVGYILPNGDLRIESRHGGKRHVSLLPDGELDRLRCSV